MENNADINTKFGRLTSYDELHDSLAANLERLRTLGIKERGSRFSKHLKLIKELNEGANTEDSVNHEKVSTAVTEATELNLICERLPIETDSNIVKKLRIILRGCRLGSEENPKISKTEARDVIFELALASQLSNSFKSIDFSTEDFLIKYDNDEYIFECKRPSSSKGIERNIKKAISQLNEKIISYPSRYGFIAISINQIITEQSSKYIDSKSPDSILKRLKRDNKIFIEDWAKRTVSWSFNPRILGLFVLSSPPAQVTEEKEFYATFLLSECDLNLFGADKFRYLQFCGEINLRSDRGL